MYLCLRIATLNYSPNFPWRSLSTNWGRVMADLLAVIHAAKGKALNQPNNINGTLRMDDFPAIAQKIIKVPAGADGDEIAPEQALDRDLHGTVFRQLDALLHSGQREHQPKRE